MIVVWVAVGLTEDRGDPTSGIRRRVEEADRGPGLADDRGPGSLLRCLGPDALAPGQAPPARGPVPVQVRALAGHVEDLRELRFRERVTPTFVDPPELARRIRGLFLEEYTEAVAEADTGVLVALGAIPPGADLREVRGQALEGQVAGFYLPEDDELVVRVGGEGLEVLDRITLAHELEHALADQNLDLPVPQRLRPGREDSDLAALAVVEGDATLTMQRFALTLPLGDQLGLLDPSVIAEAELGLEGIPHYLRQELLFPYQAGLGFVCDLYADGGWGAVNDAYRQPPTSTAEILFPSRYGTTALVDPVDPRPPSGEWSAAPARSFGAANLLWLLEAPGGKPGRALEDPLQGVSGWAGGEAHLWTRGRDLAVALVLAERDGLDVLCPAVADWYAAAFPGARASGKATGSGLELRGGRQDAVLRCTDDEVRLGIASDPATARSVGELP